MSLQHLTTAALNEFFDQQKTVSQVVVARTVPNSAVAQLFFSAVRPLIHALIDL
jgi:hypothetical protein